MAYPYDSDGDLTEDGYNELWDRLVDFVEVEGDWERAREEFFDWAHEEYPNVNDNDLWDVWRDMYESVAG